MFPEGSRFIQDIIEVIEVFPEEASDEAFRGAENKPIIESAWEA